MLWFYLSTHFELKKKKSRRRVWKERCSEKLSPGPGASVRFSNYRTLGSEEGKGNELYMSVTVSSNCEEKEVKEPSKKSQTNGIESKSPSALGG